MIIIKFIIDFNTNNVDSYKEKVKKFAASLNDEETEDSGSSSESSSESSDDEDDSEESDEENEKSDKNNDSKKCEEKMVKSTLILHEMTRI